MANENLCQKALDLHESVLSRHKNVVGLGIVPLDENAPARGQCAVGVYVRKKLPKERLSEKEIVPEHLEVPSKTGVKYVPIRVIEQGKVELERLG